MKKDERIERETTVKISEIVKNAQDENQKKKQKKQYWINYRRSMWFTDLHKYRDIFLMHLQDNSFVTSFNTESNPA